MMGFGRKAGIGCLATMLALLTACGTDLPSRGAASTGSSGLTPGQSTSTTNPSAVPTETQPTAPNPIDQGPNTLDPQPIPPADAPVGDGQLPVKAIAYTTSIKPISFLNNLGSKIGQLIPSYAGSLPSQLLPNIQRISVYVLIGWKSYPGAAGYVIRRNDTQAQADTPQDIAQYFPIIGKVDSHYQGFKDGGGLYNNLKVMNEYRYVVQAVDSAGNVLATGKDNTRAIYPLEVPTLTQPANQTVGVGVQPTFGWTPVTGADGYYVEVFSTLLSGNPVPLPMWRTYKAGPDNTAAIYGTQPDVYPGTSPAQWTMMLNSGAPCGWTVCAYKTDTGNVQTAKAIAKSNSPLGVFTP